MKFSQLPDHIKLDIASNKYQDIETLSDLTPEMIAYLDLESPNELFDRFLTWNGIMGYSGMIHGAHEAIFGGASAKALKECLEDVHEWLTEGKVDGVGVDEEQVRDSILTILLMQGGAR